MGDNRVTRYRTAAFGEGDKHSVRAFDRQLAGGALFGITFRLVQQVTGNHHTHGIPQADFRQQVIQSRQFHPHQLTADIFLRDICDLTAVTECMVEQTAAQVDRIIPFEVFQ